MAEETKSGSSGILLQIAGFGAAGAFGAMVATLFAVKSMPNGLTFELNAGAVAAFLIAGAVGWFYWRLVARMATDQAPEQRKKKFVVFSIGLGVIGVVSFLYPLRFIPPEKRKDVFTGLLLAIGVLSGVGVVMWKVRAFLEGDARDTEAKQRDRES